LPILRRTQIIQIPDSAGIWAKYDTYYNSYGLQTEEDVYDFGSGAPQTTPLKKTVATYASLGNGIVDKPASLTVKDGAGNTKAQTTFTYDEGTLATTSGTPQHVAISGSRGNATTVKSLVQGTTFLTKTLSYFDTGDVQTVTDVNGAQTTYNYASAAASCGNSFPTSVTLPLSLTKSATWNCTGGVAIQFTDENGNNTTPTYTDAFFWRPASVTDPTSAVLNFSYPSSPSFNTAESTLTFNSSNSAVDVLMTYDGLGRKHVQQKRQSPGLSNFDSVEVDYDSLGRPSRITPPYSATSAGQTNPSPAPATTTTYDALGRVLTVTDAGTGSASYTYTKNDVLVVVGPAPAGENLKKRQMEYDALGRLTSVCEITSATGSGACGQTVSQTGFWTKYSYDVLGNLTGVTQNAQAAAGSQQTRGYSYDSLSRPISVTTPEAGTVNNTYDTDATCGTSSGDLVKSADAVGNVSCYAHDALHRVTSVTYSSGPYAASMPNKYFVYDAANIATTPTATTMVNAKARLAEAYTCFSPCTTKVTDAGFSYSARGEVTDAYQSTPHSGGYYHLTQSYWAHGAPYQLSGLPGLPTISYGGAIGATSGLDGEGRFTQVTASTGQNPVTSTTYNVLAQPTQITFGSLDADTFGYDPNTGRMNQYQFSVNSQLDSGLLTWNANGTLQQLSISNAFNAADSQICTYVHDDLIRLTSANCGTAAGQTFSYDPLGNINKSGSPYSFLATYSSTTNRMTCIGGSDANCAGGFVPSYDNNGNVLNDSFHSYTWDINARPVTIDSVSMTYDALGRMVEQNRSGVYTQIVYAPAGAKLALMNGQTLQKAFVPLTGGATAVYTASGLSYYRHSDWLGSSRLASTPARTVYSTTAYAPFGEPYAQSGTADLSFTGQNQDTVGGSYDFLAREYAIQGRWPSPDPMGGDIGNPQSLNGYAYVLNSPLNLVDPLGLCGGPPGIVTHSINGVPQGPGTIFTSDPCPGIWGWNFTFYTPNNRMSMFLAKHTKAFQKKLSLKRIIRRTNLVLREIGNYMPVPCGGGGFLYGGGRVSGGVASVGLYRIESFDTRTGHSGGPFTDITVGEGVQGGYGYATYSGGESEHFLFGGIGADVGIASAGVSLYGSHVEGDSILHNQIGINGDLGVGLPFLGVGAGLGLGINTDSLTSCYDNNFH
jgi:RHS repeat-associated protein